MNSKSSLPNQTVLLSFCYQDYFVKAELTWIPVYKRSNITEVNKHKFILPGKETWGWCDNLQEQHPVRLKYQLVSQNEKNQYYLNRKLYKIKKTFTGDSAITLLTLKSWHLNSILPRIKGCIYPVAGVLVAQSCPALLVVSNSLWPHRL